MTTSLPWTWADVRAFVLGPDVTEQRQIDEFELLAQQALREFATRLNHLVFYEVQLQGTLNPGQTEYLFGTIFPMLKRIEFAYEPTTGVRVIQVPDQERLLWRADALQPEPTTGPPQYFDHHGLNFYIYPQPDQLYSLHVEGFRAVTTSINSNDAVTTIDLPPQYHQVLATYLRGLVYGSREDWAIGSQWLNIASGSYDTQRKADEGSIENATDLIRIGSRRRPPEGPRLDLPVI